MDTAWTRDDPAELVSANLRWLNGMYEAMRPYVSSSSYQNFVDPALADWPQAYYGANYPRLVEVKRRYDPDDVFHFDQSIRR
jgi:FAD/FMN-containing dehydrogenase